MKQGVFQSFENIFNSFMSDMAQRWLFGLSISDRIKALFLEIVKPVLLFQPDLIGISVLFDHQMVFGALLARLIGEGCTTKIVLGGAKFGVMPHPERVFIERWNCRIDNQDLSFHLPEVFDFLIPGEGEIELHSLCETIGSTDFSGVPNLIRRKDGKVLINSVEMISDLNTIREPDFDS